MAVCMLKINIALRNWYFCFALLVTVVEILKIQVVSHSLSCLKVEEIHWTSII